MSLPLIFALRCWPLDVLLLLYNGRWLLFTMWPAWLLSSPLTLYRSSLNRFMLSSWFNWTVLMELFLIVILFNYSIHAVVWPSTLLSRIPVGTGLSTRDTTPWWLRVEWGKSRAKLVLGGHIFDYRGDILGEVRLQVLILLQQPHMLIDLANSVGPFPLIKPHENIARVTRVLLWGLCRKLYSSQIAFLIRTTISHSGTCCILRWVSVCPATWRFQMLKVLKHFFIALVAVGAHFFMEHYILIHAELKQLPVYTFIYHDVPLIWLRLSPDNMAYLHVWHSR